MIRLLGALPRHLEQLQELLATKLAPERMAWVHHDVVLLAHVVARFIRDRGLEERQRLRFATLHCRKLAFVGLRELVRLQVRPASREAFLRGEVEPLRREDDLSESAFAAALASGDPERVDRYVLGMADRAFFRWLEDVCLDEQNDVFESEECPFRSREEEVADAIRDRAGAPLARGRDFSLFLRRLRNRDTLRVLERLERWFLRQYDVRSAAAVTHHTTHMRLGRRDEEQVLTRHSPRNYALLLGLFTLPFAGAAFAYERFPLLFDLLCSAEILAVNAAVFWFLVVRFAWQRDLTVFRAMVPRIGAGIIVGYLPVFLIDEVWDLAERPLAPLGATALLLGLTTLLYLFVEVQRRLGDPERAFARARSIFLLGLVQAQGMGLVVTSLLGGFMAARNWGPGGGETTVAALRASAHPVVGELPLVLGVEPLLAFPTAVLIMTFLSFFIGTFLQLLWEDLPITEPL